MHIEWNVLNERIGLIESSCVRCRERMLLKIGDTVHPGLDPRGRTGVLCHRCWTFGGSREDFLPPSRQALFRLVNRDGGKKILVGDTDGDRRVDIDDLNSVRNNFGAEGAADGSLTGDAFPFDGVVGIDDLNSVRNNFGAVANSVPEPAAGMLAFLAGGLLWMHLRRRF